MELYPGAESDTEYAAAFDRFRNIGQPKEDDPTDELRCELKTFDSRYNSNGVRVVLDAGSRTDIEPPGIKYSRASKSAFVLTRLFDTQKKLQSTELEIRSLHVKAALKAVVPEYRDLNIRTKSIVISGQLRCLFHYRKEIQAYGSAQVDPIAVKHLIFILDYMYGILEKEIATYTALNVELAMAPLIPSLEFDNLWMAFRYDDFIACEISGYVGGVAVISFCTMNESYWCWNIRGRTIDYDGTDFGFAYRNVRIFRYDGCKALKDLNVVPLQYHPKKEEIKAKMISRGKKFVGLHGKHHRMYDGIAEVLGPERNSAFCGEEDEFPLQSTLVQSRIMVDAGSFALARPTHVPSLDSTISTEKKEHQLLGDDQYLICHHEISGFSLTDQTWCIFKVDLIQDVPYNSDAFDALVLEENQKQMIHSLVNVHINERLTFDDVIKGKGKGMIFLLHGVPGVGKTLTAGGKSQAHDLVNAADFKTESVSDVCKRPLYSISAGNLGSTPSSVENALGDALHLAKVWNAITLIDEADVFLEQRSAHDLERNGLVSVFLRHLEYFEGVMFLTTNRIGAFDAAFKSRIHLAIKYPNLSFHAREKLWEAFIRKASDGEFPAWLNSSRGNLACENVNGRQIKNIVRTAHAIAVSNQTDMKLSHINMALNAMKDFESDIAEDREKMATEGEGFPTEIEEHSSKRRRYD